MIENIERPDFVRDEYLDFPDKLRESGHTNMFATTPYIQKEFGVSRMAATSIVSYWMKTFPRNNEVTS